MNYYFLLEDEQSLIKVLPIWLKYCGFQCERVADITQVEHDNYVMQSGQGVTQLITRALFDTIETIKASDKIIDKLIVIIDAEEFSIEAREQIVWAKIREKYCIEDLNFDIKIIVCNRCFETWLLGKRGLYPQTVESGSPFYTYYSFYNVELDDPEKMTVPSDVNETIAKYHFHYLHELFRYNHIRYRKSRPNAVMTKEYFDGLLGRAKETTDIATFKNLVDFIMNECG